MIRPALRFGKGGTKLDKSGLIIYSFHLPSGKTCPGARQCMAFVGSDGRIRDGAFQEFRCHMVSIEAAFPNLRKRAEHNRDVLKEYGEGTAEGYYALLQQDMPPDARHVRIHLGGDFFDQEYFDGWLLFIRARPDVMFYAYTKSLPFWVARLDVIPDNLILTASRGGNFDHLIDEYDLKDATVVLHPEEAVALGLEIDKDESRAMDPEVGAFALLIHGGQSPGSEASVAQKRLRKEKIPYSYAS